MCAIDVCILYSLLRVIIRVLGEMADAENSNGRRNGGDGNSNDEEVIDITTRSGRRVKPSAIIRELTSDSSKSSGGTPVKRKLKGKTRKTKRTKFTYSSSVEDSGSTEPMSQSTQGTSSETERENSSQTETDISLEVSGDDRNTNDNAALVCDEQADTVGTVRRVRSIVTKVAV